VKATLTSTSGLADHARQLGEIMDSMVAGNGNQASQATGTTKRRRARKSSEEIPGSD
jgi:hypothetical protein